MGYTVDERARKPEDGRKHRDQYWQEAPAIPEMEDQSMWNSGNVAGLLGLCGAMEDT